MDKGTREGGARERDGGRGKEGKGKGGGRGGQVISTKLQVGGGYVNRPDLWPVLTHSLENYLQCREVDQVLLYPRFWAPTAERNEGIGNFEAYSLSRHSSRGRSRFAGQHGG